MNRLVLQARLVQRGAPRWTPAGVPALDFQLEHESMASEDGTARKVSLQIRAITFGALVRTVETRELGTDGTFAGFLANARNGRGTLFHVTELD
ncbi:MAG: primosomal replication protein N [Aquabacterium sp.]